MKISYAARVAGVAGRGQDRVRVVERATGVLVVLADGAGGTGSGAEVAELVVEADYGSEWSAVLSLLDERALRIGGQSTAVVVDVGAQVRGTSVGDSGAWLIGADHVIDLTAHQQHKPLVGDGCFPIDFAETLGASTVLAASDGLWKYARRNDIVRIARGADLEQAADELVALVRLASGGLQDDVAVVLCRAAASS
jgi:PPM family protein phosphatase